MITAHDIAEARRSLGRKLAALRQAAGYRQKDLARELIVSRSSIANTEVGRQVSARDFWVRCDQVLRAGGGLVRGYDDLQALTRTHRVQVAEPTEAKRVTEFREPEGRPTSDASAEHGQDSVVLRLRLDGRESLDQSADEALVFAAGAALGLAAETTTDLFEQVRYIARDYAGHHRWQTFALARQLRDLAFDLSAKTRRPNDLADVYLIASLCSLLMSSAAFDLAHPNTAAGLARAARTLAGISGHAEAEVWALGLLATLSNWRNQPERALGHIEQARSGASSSVSLYRLNHIAARSHALLGNRRATEDAMSQAVRHYPGEAGGGFLQDEIGGEFRFDRARASACAGAAWLHFGDGVLAQRHLREALDAYHALPTALRPWAPVNGARVDLAAALVLAGDLDGAGMAMEPIFGLPVTHRISTIAGRLSAVQNQLREPQYRRSALAQQLDDRITQWAHHQQRAVSDR
ncbi:helix-turn-helix domain-containing protein [Allorhizocola rhizosphaerae]|uniref:helix-turn-helix domain-containing protein n=1 Tax=Allorhizocola rhizosphaerae TaxID=1872709 RepID=UPI000E3B8C3F|nr:helix-turn-helix transcriptional regulator [Allorhizocola rhizosphaerae]